MSRRLLYAKTDRSESEYMHMYIRYFNPTTTPAIFRLGAGIENRVGWLVGFLIDVEEGRRRAEGRAERL